MNIGKIHPIKLNQTTAYISGVIVGDGHISGSVKSKKDKSPDYRIVIELEDPVFLSVVSSMIKLIINTRSRVKKRKPRAGKKIHYKFEFRNKSFHYFLTRELKIPTGKKCYSVTIPEGVMNSPNIYWSFLAGLFDTDGGIRSNTIGFTSASQELLIQVSRVLEKEKIKHQLESWINRKYQRQYFGLKIKRESSDTFLKKLPMKNYEKQRKVFQHVGVPERSNGLDISLIKIKN